MIADEIADMMMTAGKEIEQYIIRLAQKSRAVGIHLILATQKPTVDVITGLIKVICPRELRSKLRVAQIVASYLMSAGQNGYLVTVICCSFHPEQVSPYAGREPL